VVEANAALMEEASRDMEEQTAQLQGAVLAMAAEPRAAREALSIARMSLSFARQAYHQVEPSVFYVNPDSAEELAALPDPLQAGTAATEAGRLGALAASLDELDRLAARPSRYNVQRMMSLWYRLDGESASLREALTGLAGGWAESEKRSFRQRFFVPSPRPAVARIFQGVLAVTGDLLPNYWLQDGGGWSDRQPPLAEVSGRLRAVRNIYAGRARLHGSSGAPGLVDLVREQSPVQAESTLRTLEAALSTAETLAHHPGDPLQARAMLLQQAEQATRELILAAKALGIEIIEVQPSAP